MTDEMREVAGNMQPLISMEQFVIGAIITLVAAALAAKIIVRISG